MVTSNQDMQDSLFYKTIEVVSSVCGVPAEMIQSPSKKRMVTNAKRIASKVLVDSGYGATEVSYILDIDRKSVYDYYASHETMMDKDSYRDTYLRVIDAIDEVSSTGQDLSKDVSNLKLKVLKLEGMYEHIKQLILS
jgi:hypothetical protein